MKKKVWIIIASALAAVAVAALAGLGFLLPYLKAQSDMPMENMTVYQQEDGSLELHFPEATQASWYLVEIFEPVEPAPEGEEEVQPVMLYSEHIIGTSCTLPKLPDDIELTIRITPAVEYGTLFETDTRYGDTYLSVTTKLNVPEVNRLVCTPDEDTKTVDISFEMQEGDVCILHKVNADGSATELYTLDTCTAQLSFGENGDMPMPEYDEVCKFTLTAHRNEEGIDFYALPSGEFSVVREDLLGRDVGLKINDDGNNVFTLTWNETKGEYYKVQVTNEYTEDWITVLEVPRDGERTYTTPHLEPFETYEYRVLAVGGQTVPGRKTAAESEIMDVQTKESAIFCTIWPVKDLEAYADPAKSTVLGTAEVGQAYCVLEEHEGMFGVRIGDQTLYIDSNYCMINLPEYMGNQCIYKITNSYDSIYMVHEYEIPDVTGVITQGYRYVRQSDGSYLVPLLYPTAQKLLTASQNAIDRGYKLKIYDAFRPYVATREIYDITETYLEEPIPEKTYTGKNVDLSAIDLPKPEKDEEGNEIEPEITYELLMTNKKYSLSHFLAKSGSTHNQGVALDLTIVDLSTGYEVSMQSSIHDLSWYSVLYRNNNGANILAEIMKGAGFGDLVSEWWHFQDNDARNDLEVPSVTYGVNAEGWKADDYGWRYSDANGNFYRDTTITVGDKEYTLDADGYVIE